MIKKIYSLSDNIPRQEEPSLDDIRQAILTLNRFYDYAPFGWGEIEHTINSLDEYHHKIANKIQ